MNDGPALSGKLSFISLADLFQVLGGNSSTGILKITSQYLPNPGQIYFIDQTYFDLQFNFKVDKKQFDTSAESLSGYQIEWMKPE